MKRIRQIRAEHKETLVFRGFVPTQMSTNQAGTKCSYLDLAQIWKQAAARGSRTITRERGHNARVSEDRTTPSTCRTHSLALLLDTSRCCCPASVGGRETEGAAQCACPAMNATTNRPAQRAQPLRRGHGPPRPSPLLGTGAESRKTSRVGRDRRAITAGKFLLPPADPQAAHPVGDLVPVRRLLRHFWSL